MRAVNWDKYVFWKKSPVGLSATIGLNRLLRTRYCEMSTHFSTVCLPATRAVYLHTLPVAVSILKMPGTRLSAAWDGARYSPLSSSKRPISGDAFGAPALPNTNGSVQQAAAMTSSSLVELFIFFPFPSVFGMSFHPSEASRSSAPASAASVRSICAFFFSYRSLYSICLLYTSPSPRDLSTSRMPSSA